MARASWTGAITCNLLNVPTKMYTAHEDQRPRFKQLNSATGNCIKMRRVDEVTGTEVAYEDLVKGYPSGDGFAILSDDELAALSPERTKQIQIDQFCSRDEVPARAIKSAYYLRPDKGGERAYVLLAEVMRRRGGVAVGRVVMKSVEHLVMLAVDDGTITLHTLWFPAEVREYDEPPTPELSDAEIDTACKLVEAMTKPFDYQATVDEASAKITALIEAKTEAQPPSSDLMGALERSLAVSAA